MYPNILGRRCFRERCSVFMTDMYSRSERTDCSAFDRITTFVIRAPLADNGDIQMSAPGEQVCISAGCAVAMKVRMCAQGGNSGNCCMRKAVMPTCTASFQP